VSPERTHTPDRVGGTRTSDEASPPELGHPHLHLRRTDSTNERARALALAGAPHGTLVTAEEQTAGRGRQGRRWTAPRGSSLLMSLVLRPGPTGLVLRPGPTALVLRPGPASSVTPLSEWPPRALPLAAAVAVCDVADRSKLGERALIKWPNDVVVARGSGGGGDGGGGGLAKLAGILVEGRPQQSWAVLGVGLNVAVRVEELPEELRLSAATLGEPPAAVESALARLLVALERRLAMPLADVLEEWRARDMLRGRAVAWSGGEGRADGIDAAGRLIVVDAAGRRTALEAGEVHLVPNVRDDPSNLVEDPFLP
jgi:BirA family transcriptional regulator, biotin operon repressor / biotin---[acetyl-CoA-carboxylase] ligase